MESSKTGQSDSSSAIAKLLLEGKTCNNCIHQVYLDLDGLYKAICRHPVRRKDDERAPLPKENTCELWWQWGDVHT